MHAIAERRSADQIDEKSRGTVWEFEYSRQYQFAGAGISGQMTAGWNPSCFRQTVEEMRAGFGDRDQKQRTIKSVTHETRYDDRSLGPVELRVAAPLPAARAVDTLGTGYRLVRHRALNTRTRPTSASAKSSREDGQTASATSDCTTDASAKASDLARPLTSASSVIAQRPPTFRNLRLQDLLQQGLLPGGVVPAVANRSRSSPPLFR